MGKKQSLMRKNIKRIKSKEKKFDHFADYLVIFATLFGLSANIWINPMKIEREKFSFNLLIAMVLEMLYITAISMKIASHYSITAYKKAYKEEEMLIQLKLKMSSTDANKLIAPILEKLVNNKLSFEDQVTYDYILRLRIEGEKIRKEIEKSSKNSKESWATSYNRFINKALGFKNLMRTKNISWVLLGSFTSYWTLILLYPYYIPKWLVITLTILYTGCIFPLLIILVVKGFCQYFLIIDIQENRFIKFIKDIFDYTNR